MVKRQPQLNNRRETRVLDDMTSSNESASLETKTSISSVPIELTVVLGDNSMPINQLLKMGRGAVIELKTLENEEVKILANNTLIAIGDVVVKGDNIAVEITRIIPRNKN